MILNRIQYAFFACLMLGAIELRSLSIYDYCHLFKQYEAARKTNNESGEKDILQTIVDAGKTEKSKHMKEFLEKNGLKTKTARLEDLLKKLKTSQESSVPTPPPAPVIGIPIAPSAPEAPIAPEIGIPEVPTVPPVPGGAPQVPTAPVARKTPYRSSKIDNLADSFTARANSATTTSDAKQIFIDCLNTIAADPNAGLLFDVDGFFKLLDAHIRSDIIHDNKIIASGTGKKILPIQDKEIRSWQNKSFDTGKLIQTILKAKTQIDVTDANKKTIQAYFVKTFNDIFKEGNFIIPGVEDATIFEIVTQTYQSIGFLHWQAGTVLPAQMIDMLIQKTTPFVSEKSLKDADLKNDLEVLHSHLLNLVRISTRRTICLLLSK